MINIINKNNNNDENNKLRQWQNMEHYKTSMQHTGRGDTSKTKQRQWRSPEY